MKIVYDHLELTRDYLCKVQVSLKLLRIRKERKKNSLGLLQTNLDKTGTIWDTSRHGEISLGLFQISPDEPGNI